MSAGAKHLLMAAHIADASGAPKVMARLALGCRRAGWRVTAVFPGESPFADELREGGVEVDVIPHPQRTVRWGNPAAAVRDVAERRRYLAQWREWLRGRRFDAAYISASVETLRGRACAEAGLPICWHVHEVFDPPARGMAARKVKFINKSSQMLLLCAHACRPFFEPVPELANVSVLWNGIDLMKFDPPAPEEERRALRQSLGVGDDDFLISLAGVVQPRKGVDLAVAAAKSLREKVKLESGGNIKWIVAGACVDEFSDYNRALDEAIRAADLGDDFRFLGPRQDLPLILSSLDVFALPSRQEAMPLALAEAMAAGVASVAAGVGDVREMLNGEECGWVVPPEDVDAFVGALKHAIGRPDERNCRAAAARQRAIRQFSEDRMQGEFIELIDRHF